MRLRKIPFVEEKIQDMSGLVDVSMLTKYGGWDGIFENDKPIHLELGSGRGHFIIGMAKSRPEINFVGLERVSSVIYSALAANQKAPLRNLRFILDDVDRLEFYFGNHRIERIFLNFSDPWPKVRHAKRRLLHRKYLEIYRRILAPKGEIYMRTDNAALFEYALDELAASGYSISEITKDLKPDNYGDYIMTEYEMKYRDIGAAICGLVAARPFESRND